MFSAAELVCHAFGDYVIQSDWMATAKTKKSTAALAHVLTYTACFLPLAGWDPVSPPGPIRWQALLFIAATHFIIDRWRLARYVCWAKNFLAPKYIEVLYPEGHEKAGQVEKLIRNAPWLECTGTGYDSSKPPWMAVWLMIVCDNCFHVLCNALALQYL